MPSRKPTPMGDAPGVITRKKSPSLTAEIASHLNPHEGDRLTPYDPAFEKQMLAAERVTRKQRNVLSALAK